MGSGGLRSAIAAGFERHGEVGPAGDGRSRGDLDACHGFGRVAKACALKKHWDVGLDHDGHPITARTRAFNVRFNRD